MRGSGRTTDALQRSWAYVKSGRHMVYMCINRVSMDHTFHLAARLFPEAEIIPEKWEFRLGNGSLRISTPTAMPTDHMRGRQSLVVKDHVVEDSGEHTQKFVMWVDEWNRVNDR